MAARRRQLLRGSCPRPSCSCQLGLLMWLKLPDMFALAFLDKHNWMPWLTITWSDILSFASKLRRDIVSEFGKKNKKRADSQCCDFHYSDRHIPLVFYYVINSSRQPPCHFHRKCQRSSVLQGMDGSWMDGIEIDSISSSLFATAASEGANPQTSCPPSLSPTPPV